MLAHDRFGIRRGALKVHASRPLSDTTPTHHHLIMPPLPSLLDEETTNIIASLERRQKDLADFQIPRLRTCTGPLTQQQQYAAELRDDLDLFSLQLEVSFASYGDGWSPRPI